MLKRVRTTPLDNVRTWYAGAFVAGFSLLDAGASVEAGRRVAGQVAALAVLARVFLRTLAPVPAHVVDAQPTVLAGRGAGVALVDVLFARRSGEERRAGTPVPGFDAIALAAVSTRARGTRVGELALVT